MNNSTIYFDVDETLVVWDYGICDKHVEIYGVLFGVHMAHIRKLMQHKRSGDKIVIWSAGGEKWARTVVKALEIEDYVDVILSKPNYYYDDKELSEFNSGRMYLKLDGSMATGDAHKQRIKELLNNDY